LEEDPNNTQPAEIGEMRGR